MPWRHGRRRVPLVAPDDSEAYCYRAMARVKQGKYAEALADCDEALRLDPKDFLAYRTRGAAPIWTNWPLAWCSER